MAPPVDRADRRGRVAVHEDLVARRVGVADLDRQRAVEVVEHVVAADLQGMDVRRDQIVLALVLHRDHAGDDLEIDVDEGRQRAEIDDVLEQRPVLGIGELGQHQLRDRYADAMDVGAAQADVELLGVVVDQVATRNDGGDVLGKGLGVHCHHDVDAFPAPCVAAFRNANLEPGRQTFDVRREYVARCHRDAHPEQGLGEHAVGGSRAGAVYVREANHEIVVACTRTANAFRCRFAPRIGWGSLDGHAVTLKRRIPVAACG